MNTNTFNPFQKWVIRRIRLNPENLVDMKFNVEQALRDTWAKAKQRYLAEGRQEKLDCLRCPLYRADQIRLTGISDDLSMTTEGKIQAERKDDKPDWWKRRNPHLVETQSVLPKIRFTTVKLDPMPPT